MIADETKATPSVFSIGAFTFAAYSGCNTGKKILSAAMPQIIALGLFSAAQLGYMSSIFFLAYGCGQLINGIIGNKISPRVMITAGLGCAGIIAALFPFIYTSPSIPALWGVYGFLLSMLWGPVARTIGENTDVKSAELLMSLMIAASVVGMLITYALAYLSSKAGNWGLAFYISGGIMIFIAVIWFVFSARLKKFTAVCRSGAPECRRVRLKLFFNTGFVLVLIISMLNGIIRNAVDFWIPTYISQGLGMSVEAAASISMLLPFFNVAATFISLYMLRRLKHNEFRVIFILFVFATVMFTVIPFQKSVPAFLSIGALLLASGAMTGVCNMIFSAYALRFRSTGNISGVTGLLDFSAYISASAASSLFAAMLESAGWSFVAVTWLMTTLAGAVITVFAGYKSRCFKAQ